MIKVFASLSIALVLIVSCGSEETKDKSQKEEEEEEDPKIALTDSLSKLEYKLQVIDKLSIMVDLLESQSKRWVENQSRSDSPEKIKTQQNIEELQSLASNTELSDELNELIDDWITEIDAMIIKNLSDLESYDDVANRLVAYDSLEKSAETVYMIQMKLKTEKRTIEEKIRKLQLELER